MALDVNDLVENLEREVNPPGTLLFPNATVTEYEGHLRDSFWELVQRGYISGFTEDDGIITEDVATPVNDLGRDYQQLLVVTAGLRILRLLMISINTQFRAKAGPVEFETQKSAQTLKGALDYLHDRFAQIVSGLPNSRGLSTTYYFDPLLERNTDFYPGSTFVGY
jgi:hypothetical protein